MAQNDNLVMGIDIGSTEVCVSICNVERSGELSLLGVGTSVSRGMSKGDIHDSDELQTSVERAMRKAELEAGVSPTRAIVNIPPFGLNFIHNLGLLLSKEETGQISESDKIECIRRSKNVAKLSEQKLLHVIPLVFKVDGTLVKNPVGVFGKTLEVQTHLIFGQSSSVFSVTKLVKSLNLQINGLMFDMLGTAQICLSDEERMNGAMVIDIGGRFTKIGIFKNNLLHKSFVVAIGGETFTNDVAICLKVGIPEAERLKVLEGTINPVDDHETVEISTLTEGRKEIKRILLAQILEARVNELINLIDAEGKLQKYEDYTCVVCGGGGLLPGIVEKFKQKFHLKTRYGVQKNMESIIENPTYATSIGLIVYGIKTNAIPLQNFQTGSLNSALKQWFKQFF